MLAFLVCASNPSILMAAARQRWRLEQRELKVEEAELGAGELERGWS